MAGNSQIRSVVASAGLLLFVSRVLFSGDAFATYCDYYCEEKKKIVKRAGSAARNACNNAVRAIEAYTDCYEDPACVDEAAGVMIANAAVGAATLGLLAAGPPGAVVAAGATLITSVAAFVYEAWSYYDCVSYPDCDNEKQSMYNAIVGAENANNVLSLANADLNSAVAQCSIH